MFLNINVRNWTECPLCTWLYAIKDQRSCLTTAFLKILTPCIMFYHSMCLTGLCVCIICTTEVTDQDDLD